MAATTRKKGPVKGPVKGATKTPARKAPVKRVRKATIIEPGDVSKAVGEVPPLPARGAQKSTKYRDALEAVRKLGKGKSVAIATFTGKSGANDARKALNNGTYLCDGEPGEWDFQTRKTDTGSTLWATLK